MHFFLVSGPTFLTLGWFLGGVPRTSERKKPNKYLDEAFNAEKVKKIFLKNLQKQKSLTDPENSRRAHSGC